MFRALSSQKKTMVIEKKVQYSDPEGTILEGVLVHPAGADAGNKKFPGVVIFHAFRGCLPFEIERAHDLAKLGYVAFAADLYGKGKRGTTFEEGRELLSAKRNGILGARIKASIDTLAKQGFVASTKVAAIGYCFGGLCALDAARQNFGIVAAVSFHGTLLPLEGAELKHFPATVQVHHGDADTHINSQVTAFQDEMRSRKVDWSFTTYGDAKHSFTEPEAPDMPGVGYNEQANRRSWAAMVALFEERLKH